MLSGKIMATLTGDVLTWEECPEAACPAHASELYLQSPREGGGGLLNPSTDRCNSSYITHSKKVNKNAFRFSTTHGVEMPIVADAGESA